MQVYPQLQQDDDMLDFFATCFEAHNVQESSRAVSKHRRWQE